MRINKRESVLLAILMIVVLVMFGAKWLVFPAYNNWAAQKSELARIKLSQFPDDAAAGDRQSDGAAEISAFFVPKTNSENFHKYFHDYIKASGLELGSISVNDENEDLPPGFSLVDVNLSLTGTQAQAMRFLESVELLKKSIVVKSLSMTPGKDQNISMVVSFRVYCIESGSNSGIMDFVTEEPAFAEGFRFLSE